MNELQSTELHSFKTSPKVKRKLFTKILTVIRIFAYIFTSPWNEILVAEEEEKEVLGIQRAKTRILWTFCASMHQKFVWIFFQLIQAQWSRSK